MGELKKYRKLDINNIEIKYGPKLIKFNLFNELKITEEIIQNELQYQPSYYGFICLLHKKLLTVFEERKQRRKQVWAKLYLEAKEKIQASTGRPHTEEMAKSFADSHPRYIKLTTACIKAKDDADTIFACMKGFEQRKDILQTISSNHRKQI